MVDWVVCPGTHGTEGDMERCPLKISPRAAQSWSPFSAWMKFWLPGTKRQNFVLYDLETTEHGRIEIWEEIYMYQGYAGKK